MHVADFLYFSGKRTILTGWFIVTEAESVYCAVRTGSLNEAVCSSSLKG